METAQPPVAPAASAGGNPLGVTAAPFIRSGTAAVVDLAERAERLGYDSFWVAEVTGIEAFSVLGAASRAAPGVGLTRAGYGDAVQAIRAAHRAGDRAGALAAVPDEMVDAIDVVGDETLVRDTISAYRRAGVDVPVVFPLTWGAAGQDALESTLRAAIAPPVPGTPHGSADARRPIWPLKPT